MQVILNAVDETSTIQRTNSLKRSIQQAQLSEYGERDIHKVKVTASGDSVNFMQIKSNISGMVYSLHLEFTEDAKGIGEEIKNTLKEKYLQQEIKSRSGESEAEAVQSLARDKGEMEERDA